MQESKSYSQGQVSDWLWASRLGSNLKAQRQWAMPSSYGRTMIFNPRFNSADLSVKAESQINLFSCFQSLRKFTFHTHISHKALRVHRLPKITTLTYRKIERQKSGRAMRGEVNRSFKMEGGRCTLAGYWVRRATDQSREVETGVLGCCHQDAFSSFTIFSFSALKNIF